jgi:hypothetical protein
MSKKEEGLKYIRNALGCVCVPAGYGEWIFHGGQQAGAEGVHADPRGPQIGRRVQRNRLFAGIAISVGARVALYIPFKAVDMNEF